MTASEPFNFITTTKDSTPRKQYPDLIVTTVPAQNCNLTQFALAGNAIIELDIETEKIIRTRGFIPAIKRGQKGGLGEDLNFAKFRYNWNDEDFILYTLNSAVYGTQYILKEPRGNETTLSHSSVTDALLKAIGEWATSDQDVVYVFDGIWRKDKGLWREVQKARWDDVILDPDMKKELVEVANKFFDSEDIYKQFGVPWKVCSASPSFITQFPAFPHQNTSHSITLILYAALFPVLLHLAPYYLKWPTPLTPASVD